MHDVPLVDTTCIDQDEDEERDVNEWRQLQSDASWTSEDETQNVTSLVLAKCLVNPGLPVFHLSEERISFPLTFLPLPRDFAGFRSVDG